VKRCKHVKSQATTLYFSKGKLGRVCTYIQRWAKGPIDRSSDTDSIFRLYRFVLSSDSLIDRSCFLVLSSDFCIWRLCRSVLSSDSLINRSCFLVLSSDFCIVRLCRPVLSKKSLYRYWERRLWAVWWSFIIWPRIYTDSQHMTIYTILNIPRTCGQLDGRARTFTSCMT